MKNNILESLWNNNVVKVLIIISLFIGVSIPFSLQASEGFVYKMLFFMLLSGFWGLAVLYFIDELKKINDMIWRPMLVLVILTWIFLIRIYPGLSTSEDGTLSLLQKPLVWMLVGTVIAYLVVLFYNRNKSESMK